MMNVPSRNRIHLVPSPTRFSCPDFGLGLALLFSAALLFATVVGILLFVPAPLVPTALMAVILVVAFGCFLRWIAPRINLPDRPGASHRRLLSAALVLLLLPSLLSAQTAAVTGQTTKPAGPLLSAPPVLTEVEQLRLDNLRLQSSLLQAQQKQLLQDYQNFLSAANAEHPGWRLDPVSGQFTASPAAK